MVQPLQVFFAGESAQVAEILNFNFNLLYGLITGVQPGSNGFGVGSSTATAVGRANFIAQGSMFSSSIADGHAASLLKNEAVAEADGSTDDAVIGSSMNTGDGASTGTGAAVGIITVGNTATAVGSASGTNSDASAVGSDKTQGRGVATGGSTCAATGIVSKSSVGNATGGSTAAATGQGGGTETTSGTAITQTTQIIFASATPGTPSSTNLVTFSLTANPGQVLVNGSADSSAGTANVELYYSNHTVFRETQGGAWFSWASAGVWNSTTTPVPVVIQETTEGYVLNSTTQTIYGSTVVGQPAPPGATVGNGLSTWTLTAVPGQIRFGSTVDTTTSNVVQLYYHNHAVYELNTSNNWFVWVALGSATAVASPIPTTPTFNITPIGNQATFTTFQVSGTIQAYTTIPTLQYQDNGGTWLALPDTPPITTNSFSFVHPPVATTSAAFTVGVRDANAVTVSALSAPFQVFTPGVVTLQSITLDNTTGQGGAPAGTVIGQITVAVSGGTFTGSVNVTGTDAASFRVNSSLQLVTTAVLASRSYAITLTATMAGAANNNISISPTIVMSAESPNGTAVTTAGPTIVGSNAPGVPGATLTWSLVAGTSLTFLLPGKGGSLTDGAGHVWTLPFDGGGVNGQVTEDGASIPTGSGTLQLTVANGTMFAQSVGGQWYNYNGTNFVAVAAPVGGSGNQIKLNGVTQTLFTQVTQLYYISHTLYQANTASGSTSWSFFNGNGVTNNQTSGASWTSSASPIPVITLSATTFAPNAPIDTEIGQIIVTSAGNTLTPLTITLTPTTSVSADFLIVRDAVGDPWLGSGPAYVAIGLANLAAGTYPINITVTL